MNFWQSQFDKLLLAFLLLVAIGLAIGSIKTGNAVAISFATGLCSTIIGALVGIITGNRNRRTDEQPSNGVQK